MFKSGKLENVTNFRSYSFVFSTAADLAGSQNTFSNPTIGFFTKLSIIIKPIQKSLSIADLCKCSWWDDFKFLSARLTCEYSYSIPFSRARLCSSTWAWSARSKSSLSALLSLSSRSLSRAWATSSAFSLKKRIRSYISTCQLSGLKDSAPSFGTQENVLLFNPTNSCSEFFSVADPDSSGTGAAPIVRLQVYCRYSYELMTTI